MHKEQRVFLLISLSLVFCMALIAPGCSSTNPGFYDESGVLLEEVPPVNYRIAVSPFIFPASPGDDPADYPFHLSPEDLQSIFVRELNKLNTSLEVMAVSSLDPYGAARIEADLLIRPFVQNASLEYSNLSSRCFLSGCLWFLTWLGGLYVDDTEYDANFIIHCEFINIASKSVILDDLNMTSEEVTLSFFDRNPWFSLGFFESFLIPPFWTNDNEECTSDAIVDKSMALLAADLKNFLLSNYPDKEELSNLVAIHY